MTFTCLDSASAMDSNNGGGKKFDRISSLLMMLASAMEELNSEGSDESGDFFLPTQVSVVSSSEPDVIVGPLEHCGSTISSPEDLYGLLGVDSTATDAEITRAYHNLCDRFYPDTNGPSYEGSRDYEKFLELQNAITTLSDPVARKKYDDERTVEGYEINFSPLRLTARSSRAVVNTSPLEALDE